MQLHNLLVTLMTPEVVGFKTHDNPEVTYMWWLFAVSQEVYSAEALYAEQNCIRYNNRETRALGGEPRTDFANFLQSMLLRLLQIQGC